MLMDWWMIDPLPLPLLIVAGLLLAIASNRNKRIRVSHSLGSATHRENASSKGKSGSAAGVAIDSQAKSSADAKLSPHDDKLSAASGLSHLSTARSQPQSSNDAPSPSHLFAAAQHLGKSQAQKKRRSPSLPQFVKPSETRPDTPISFTIATPGASQPQPSSDEDSQ